MSIPNRILIVEDEGIQAMGLEETLADAGYEVIAIADNGEDALNYIRETAIDLVVMDIHIKGSIDGIETAKSLRLIKPELPVIYLSAYMDQETIRRAEETLPAAFISKPYRQAQLLSCIQQAIEGKKP